MALTQEQFEEMKRQFANNGGLSADKLKRTAGGSKGLSGSSFTNTLRNPNQSAGQQSQNNVSEIDQQLEGVDISGIDKNLLDQLKQRGMVDKIKELAGYTAQASEEMHKSVPTKIAEGINTGVEKVIQSKPYQAATYVPKKLVGGVVGAIGGVIGGEIGAVGQTVVNFAQGEPLTKDVLKSAIKNAKDTASFGFDIGQKGTEVAPLALAGDIPIAVMGAAQVYIGAQNMSRAVESHDPVAFTEATGQWLTGALMTYGGFTGLKNAYESGKLGNTVVRSELISDIGSGLKNKTQEVKSSLNPTGEQLRQNILKTSEKDLVKLSDSDRAIFYEEKLNQAKTQTKAQQEALAEKYKSLEQNIKTQQEAIKLKTTKSIEALKEKNVSLEQDVARATVEEVRQMKPKLLNAMKENSQKYRQLVETELNKVSDTKISGKELGDFIDSKYIDTPQKAVEIKSSLKINPESEYTATQIYENTKQLRQQISQPGKKGTSSFSAKDMQVNESISLLSDFLLNKGVDLAEANKFWAEYAPLRNKLIKNVQPFTPAGSETKSLKTFADNLRKSLEGKDPYNEKFIRATEELIGEKIGNKSTREALAKLDKNQKEIIARELEADIKLQEIDSQLNSLKENKTSETQAIKKEGEASSRGIKIEKQQVDLKAKRTNRARKVVGKVIIGGLGISVGQKLLNWAKGLL